MQKLTIAEAWPLLKDWIKIQYSFKIKWPLKTLLLRRDLRLSKKYLRDIKKNIEEIN